MAKAVGPFTKALYLQCFVLSLQVTLVPISSTHSLPGLLWNSVYSDFPWSISHRITVTGNIMSHLCFSELGMSGALIPRHWYI